MVAANTTEREQNQRLSASDLDEIPPTLGAKELIALLGVSASAFHLYRRQGRYARFELKNAVGRKKYSGVLVRAYLRGGGK